MSEQTTGLTHSAPRQTEMEALMSVAPHLKRMKRDIMLRVVASGESGLTPDEVPGLINTVRRRFVDLWKEGQIRPTDRTRRNSRGKNETVWVAGRDEVGMATTRETKDQKISRLAHHIRMLIVEGERLKGRLWHHAENAYTHAYSDNCGCESCAATRTFDALAKS